MTDASKSTLDGILAYESGELDDQGVVDLFQSLIDCGLVWQLQGSYGRTAQGLIDQGYCHPRLNS